jgi:hypothetical protein
MGHSNDGDGESTYSILFNRSLEKKKDIDELPTAQVAQRYFILKPLVFFSRRLSTVHCHLEWLRSICDMFALYSQTIMRSLRWTTLRIGYTPKYVTIQNLQLAAIPDATLVRLVRLVS